MKLYCVRDVKSLSYNSPFAAENDLTAARLFESEVKSGGGLPSKFPADFELVVVGTFDPSSATVGDLPTEVLLNGMAFQE
ncbi:MAG: nonstructural protein [Microvirus sp.]|nr:MAG: nonstructural protein [Microvirus sp.]